MVVSHDRDLLDRLCTEVVGLDGRGGSGLYGSVSQWLTAYEQSTAAERPAPSSGKAKVEGSRGTAATATKPRKLSYREQQELDQMEAAILAAEEAVTERQAEVEGAAADHVALAEACRALEEAQRKVEHLYTRWQELEAKRDL